MEARSHLGGSSEPRDNFDGFANRRKGRRTFVNIAVLSAPKPKAAKKKKATMTLLQFAKSATDWTSEVRTVKTCHCEEGGARDISHSTQTVNRARRTAECM